RPLPRMSIGSEGACLSKMSYMVLRRATCHDFAQPAWHRAHARRTPYRHRPLFGVDRDWTPCSSNQREIAPRNSEKILIYSATNRYTIRTEIAPFVAYFRNTTRYP